MSDEEDGVREDIPDETIERIAARLRPLPEVNPEARARLLVAVAAERERTREREARAPLHRRVIWWSAAVAAAAVAAAVLGPHLTGPAEGGSPAVANAPAKASLATPGAPVTPDSAASPTLVAREVGAMALRPVELVFRAPAARRVSVVGDFSGWDPAQAVMTRDSGSGLWSVTLRLAPGRHVYAFLVDDSIWVRDPRAPSAPDADFGRPGSVLLVGRP